MRGIVSVTVPETFMLRNAYLSQHSHIVVDVRQFFYKIASCRLRQLALDFEAVHRTGIKHQALAILSILKTEETGKTELSEKIPVPMILAREERNEEETEFL